MEEKQAETRKGGKPREDGLRTIGEAARELGIATYVLRFWEDQFSVIKPLRRAGGWRLYHPNDLRLLRGLKALLHEDGMSLRGVRQLVRKQGAACLIARASGEMPDFGAGAGTGSGSSAGGDARPLRSVAEKHAGKASQGAGGQDEAFRKAAQRALHAIEKARAVLHGK